MSRDDYHVQPVPAMKLYMQNSSVSLALILLPIILLTSLTFIPGLRGTICFTREQFLSFVNKTGSMLVMVGEWWRLVLVGEWWRLAVVCGVFIR